MSRLLKRIAIHGGLAAVLLAAIGLMYSELAGMVLAAGRQSARAAVAPHGQSPAALSSADLRRRVPLTMAAWGFAFVALCEGFMYLWRGTPAGTNSGPAPKDEAEALLEELLRQVESAKAAG